MAITAVCIAKKGERTGQDIQKSHKVVIPVFRLGTPVHHGALCLGVGEKPPTVPIKTKICMMGSLRETATFSCTQSFRLKFVGVTILQGSNNSNSPFSY